MRLNLLRPALIGSLSLVCLADVGSPTRAAAQDVGSVPTGMHDAGALTPACSASRALPGFSGSGAATRRTGAVPPVEAPQDESNRYRFEA